MIVVPPINIIDNLSKLVYSSLTDGTNGDPSIWLISNTYAPGSRVRVTATNKIYEALVYINTGGPSPNVDVTLSVPKWIEVGYVNRLRMFDLYTNTTTESSSGNIILQINPIDRIDNIAFTGMVNVTQITLRVTDQIGVDVYPTTILPVTSSFLNVPNIVIMSDTRIYITITGTGTIKIADLIVGKSQNLGTLQSGVQVTTLNFSKIDRDIFGNAVLIKRGSVPKITCKTLVLAEEVARILNVRSLVNAVPALWIASTNIPEYSEPFAIFGIYRNFNIQTDNTVSSSVNLELEGI